MMNRKNLLYALAGVLGAAIVWQFVVEGVFARFDSLERSISSRRRTLEEIRLLEEHYLRGRHEPGGLDTAVRGRAKDYTPLSFLERLSVELGVDHELVYREPRSIRDEKDFLEVSVRVELRNLDSETLVQYLYEIENSGQFLRFRNLNIRPHEGLLRAGFEVATIVPAG